MAFAGGIAHDFNNALNVISASLSCMRDGVVSADEMPELAGEMLQAVADASKLAKRLLRLGRPEPMTFERVKLQGVVERAVVQARHVMSDAIEVVVDVSPDLRAHGSPGELHQVFLNLFLNARDAMPGGGRITIHARTRHFDLKNAIEHHLGGEGEYIEVNLVDTGTGMEEAVLARAFEPFFTTKSPGKGTGLGLAMIHQIVRGHGGAISVSSVVGHGTTFRLLLPRG
jgi:signal transduction histidine kinase